MSLAGGLGRRLEKLEADRPSQDPFAAVSRKFLADWGYYGPALQETYRDLKSRRDRGEEMDRDDAKLFAVFGDLAVDGDIADPVKAMCQQFAVEDSAAA